MEGPLGMAVVGSSTETLNEPRWESWGVGGTLHNQELTGETWQRISLFHPDRPGDSLVEIYQPLFAQDAQVFT